MILVLGHTKGGVGKSILALNIAVERARQGSKVLLIDCDPDQYSVGRACAVRNKNPNLIPIVCRFAESVNNLIQDVNNLKKAYEHIIIDVGGRDSSLLRASLLITDVFLIPVGPESVEIWAIDDISNIISKAKALHNFSSYAVLNRSKHQGNDNHDALKILKEYEEFEVLPLSIGNRSAFSSSFGKGQSIVEYRPKNMIGIKEISDLISKIFG